MNGRKDGHFGSEGEMLRELGPDPLGEDPFAPRPPSRGRDIAAQFEMSSLFAMDTWGRYGGAGYEGTLIINGRDYRVWMFCSTQEAPAFEILQVVETAAWERTAPGFDLIRDRFEVYGR